METNRRVGGVRTKMGRKKKKNAEIGGNKVRKEEEEEGEQRRERKMRPTAPSRKKSWMASIVEVPSREKDTGSFPGAERA